MNTVGSWDSFLKRGIGLGNAVDQHVSVTLDVIRIINPLTQGGMP
jgi:hypothetical protein